MVCDTQWCKVLQSSTKLCKVAQSGAQYTRISKGVQSGTMWCKCVKLESRIRPLMEIQVFYWLKLSTLLYKVKCPLRWVGANVDACDAYCTLFSGFWTWNMNQWESRVIQLVQSIERKFMFDTPSCRADQQVAVSKFWIFCIYGYLANICVKESSVRW